MSAYKIPPDYLDKVLQGTGFSSATKALLIFARNPDNASILTIKKLVEEAGIPKPDVLPFTLMIRNSQLNGAIIRPNIGIYISDNSDYYGELLSNPFYIYKAYSSARRKTLDRWTKAIECITTFIHNPFTF